MLGKHEKASDLQPVYTTSYIIAINMEKACEMSPRFTVVANTLILENLLLKILGLCD